MSTELVIATPLLLFLIMAIVQFALWQHANHVARTVAQQSVAAARVEGASASTGQDEAHTVLDQIGTKELRNAQVTTTRRRHDNRHRQRRILVSPAVLSSPRAGRRHRTHGAIPTTGERAMTLPGATHASDRERGSVTTELVIVTPLLLLLLLFVVALGRMAGSRIDINGAASEAARSASIARTPLAAQDAARQTATAALADQHVTCASLDVTTDTSRFVPAAPSRSPFTAT